MFTTNRKLIALSATMAMLIPAAGAQAATSQTQHQARHFQTPAQARHFTSRHSRRSTANTCATTAIGRRSR